MIAMLQQLAAEHAVISYGLIFFGVILEGEFTLILAGIFTNLHILSGPWALVAGGAGAIVKALLWYYGGFIIFRKRPSSKFFNYLKRQVLFFLPKFIERPFWSIFISKFVYFIKRLTLIFSGYMRINIATYMKAEVLSSAVWVPVLFSIGYFFSYAAFNISRDFRKYTLIVLAFTVCFFILERLCSFVFQFIEQYGEEDIL